MSAISFFDVVRVVDSPAMNALGIERQSGVVVGIAGEEPGPVQYAVLIGEQTYMVDCEHLVSTGERRNREEFYTGRSLKVNPQRYASREGGADEDDLPSDEGSV